VERVFAYRRLRRLFAELWTLGDLVRFHSAHKLLLLAHAPEAYRALGRLVAGARGLSRWDVEARYVDGFMRALAQPATTRRHTNALQHMAGYFKNRLDVASRRELADAIADYSRGLVPLVVPITLLRCHVGLLDVKYLAGQIYLQPSMMTCPDRRSASTSVPYRKITRTTNAVFAGSAVDIPRTMSSVT
jgi:uncharacterized protein YbgA (DUF1722 family)